MAFMRVLFACMIRPTKNTRTINGQFMSLHRTKEKPVLYSPWKNLSFVFSP